MHIELDRGVAGILFGASELDVTTKLGAPDKVWLDVNESRNLTYFSQKLVFKIEPDGRLGWIEVHNQNATWLDIKPFETNRAALLQQLETALCEHPNFEDYGHMESYYFSNSFVELQYHFGELSSLHFGVKYDENDVPLWPKPISNV